ncbi:MAG: rhomboid family intramembrane serine protease [Solirubrobacteraceae bacterium]
MAVCYRHPDRETGVSCSSCGRAICTDCMTPTPVGMRCPACSRERTRVKTVRSLPSAPSVTMTLIAINVIVFVAEFVTGGQLVSGSSGTVVTDGVLFGPAIVHQHEYWRLITSGFLHDGLLHILFNMLFLWIVGPQLESAIGSFNFAVVYVVSLLAGSFGALLFQPDVPTLGASGALFGLLGALMVVAYDRGISIWRSGLGPILVINLVFSVAVRNISIGGHLGGFVGGVIAGWLVVQLSQRRGLPAAAMAGCALVAVASVVGALAVAGGTGLTPHGISFTG